MPSIGHHRRFTANHTWHVNWGGQPLFAKANPHHAEARTECAGHARIRGLYPTPRLRSARRLAHWTVLVYDRWPHVGHDAGLLLDEIVRADHTHDTRRLNACLDAVLGHYRHVITSTLQQTTNEQTIAKLYGERAAPDGRLDRYYRADAPWPLGTSTGVRPSQLVGTTLIVNGREHLVDFTDLVIGLRLHFARNRSVWAAVTQGDPTDMNIGWSPTGGPVWFDYDTSGLNALPGEFACFLLYQRLHGAWLTPHYNPAAFRDHPSALAPEARIEPVVGVRDRGSALAIDYQHAPTVARQNVLRRYLDEVVKPIAGRLGIADLMGWLRPYLLMRLLAVYHLGDLEPRDTALSLALLAQVLDPATTLPALLALAPSQTEVA